MIRLPAAEPPVLLVVVDTEEEFDWGAAFDRNAVSVGHMREIVRFQEICDRAEVRPIYLIDYPIATQEESLAALAPLVKQGRAAIGAHLHPWVNPPWEDEVNRRNSYPGNLAPQLERRKLAALGEAIAANLGVRPRTYKAGRYGFGPASAETLAHLGYRNDLSFCPAFDFRADGGPDYRATPADLAWLDVPGGLLEIPTTGGFIGRLRAAGQVLQRLAESPAGRRLRLGGALSRSGLLGRVRLSPEGYGLAATRALTRALLADGVRVFSFSLHSPSIRPGHTSYVQDEADRACLLGHVRDYLQFFRDELGGQAMTPDELRERIDALVTVA